MTSGASRFFREPQEDIAWIRDVRDPAVEMRRLVAEVLGTDRERTLVAPLVVRPGPPLGWRYRRGSCEGRPR